MDPPEGTTSYGFNCISSVEYYATTAEDKLMEIEEVNSSLYYVSTALDLN